MYMLESCKLKFEVHPSGDICRISADNILINRHITSPAEPMAANIYLRIKEGEGYSVHPLIGRYAKELCMGGGALLYRGEVGDIAYEATLSASGYMWLYNIALTNSGKAVNADLVYVQDIGLASEGHITANPAYNSHYIDHKVFENADGFTICSRQNQNQGGYPYLQLGAFCKTVGYSVDAYPLYGMDYKTNNAIGDLFKPRLNNRLYQYEYAQGALQTEEFILKGEGEFCFYGLFSPSLEGRIQQPMPVDKAVNKPTQQRLKVLPINPSGLNLDNVIASKPIDQGLLNRLYPARGHEERHEGELLSFFKSSGEHVTLMQKERLIERAHGHIITSFSNSTEGVMTSSSHIFGVFASLIAVGNTSFNKLNTHAKDGLNISKVGGQRLMIRRGGGAYRLLTMPALYEMGFNYARWLYIFDDDMLEVVSYIYADSPVLKLVVKSHNDIVYDFLLYDELCHDIEINVNSKGYTAKYSNNTMQADAYPALEFKASIDGAVISKHCGDIITIELLDKSGFELMTEARLEGVAVDIAHLRSFDDEVEHYRDLLQAGMLGFKLKHPDIELNKHLDKLNLLALWYSHNARIHYASPHGIEQYSGAAWGTRDVCQGPFEYFMAAQNYDVCKNILLTVYKHQYIDNGDWPQWFMFDNYNLQHHHSHGDIIVWPLKALASYLAATNDYAILDIKLPYTQIEGYKQTTEVESLMEHVKRQVNAIEGGFIKDTHLSCYGGGDWDDTLSPARPELAKSMVSGWTVSLTYQAFRAFAAAIHGHDEGMSGRLNALASSIKADFHNKLIKDGVVTGFLLFNDGGAEHLLHPSDNKTGINYRLLPMMRGIISEMFDPTQAKSHYALIKAHMQHPDGVRLMDTTCAYNGGETRYFMRAETSAAFLREVSLHYVHAQIRFIEAMAKLGEPDEAWRALYQINPIGIQEAVPNAALRQSNVYFTSSDAAFDNRYAAAEGFDKIKSGDVAVKAGWRLYSSGPGIYLNQLISKLLGINIVGGDIMLDPVLPKGLDGLCFEYKILGKAVTMEYNIGRDGAISKIMVDGEEVNFTRCNEPYRGGGAIFPADIIKNNSHIQIYIDEKEIQ